MIKFIKSNKYFGIHSNRVRKIVEPEYQRKYGKDSTKYKDFKEKSELIESLENSDNNYLSGYAYSPRRVIKLANYNSPGFYRNYNRGNPSLNKMSNINNQDVDEAYLSYMIKHNNELNKQAKSEANRVKITESRITPYRKSNT